MTNDRVRHRARRSRRDARGEGGYTLLEILVAVGILAILGGGLATLLTQGMSIWRRAENRGRVYEQARVLLDQIGEDLRSTVTVASEEQDSSWVRFIGDDDPKGRQRLRFVRTISGETADPILREGGQYLSVKTPATYDGTNDVWEAREGLLGAPGGLMEILYSRDPRPGNTTLWRGVRTPLGGLGTFFEDRNVDRDFPWDEEKANADEEKRKPFAGIARPLTEGVLYLSFGFWGPTTNTWDPAAIPRTRAREGVESGPLFHWDSTRALLEYSGESGEFTFKAREGSLSDYSDDMFPERVEITLVLRDDDRESLTLSTPSSLSEMSFRLSRAISVPDDERNRFIRVGEEWVAVEGVSGRDIRVAKGGRGARGTEPRSHGVGTPVDVGATFRRVIELPGSRRGRVDSGISRQRTFGRRRS